MKYTSRVTGLPGVVFRVDDGLPRRGDDLDVLAAEAAVARRQQLRALRHPAVLGRDARHPDEFEDPLEMLRLMPVDVPEHAINLESVCHGALPEGAACVDARSGAGRARTGVPMLSAHERRRPPVPAGTAAEPHRRRPGM